MTTGKPTAEKIGMRDRKNPQPQTASSILIGSSLYIERARKAFPVLVRQALAGQKLVYSDLADELRMANPRNLNYVLGAIGRAIEALSSEWGEKIPPLQCIAVNKNTGLPGEGIGWFIRDLKDFNQQAPETRREIIALKLIEVFNYRYWEDVLNEFGLRLVPSSAAVNGLIEKARNSGGVGECEDHRRLKLFVASNPDVIGLSGFAKGKIEYCFPSADKIDVVFIDGQRWVGVEVKGPSSNDADLVRGLFQTVKYAALREAELKSKFGKGQTEVMLVISRKLPDNLIELKNLLGVHVVDGTVVPEEKPDAKTV